MEKFMTEKNIIIMLAIGGVFMSLLIFMVPTLATSNMSLGLSVGSASYAAVASDLYGVLFSMGGYWLAVAGVAASGVMGPAALVLYL